jgi:hypothetical protein
VISSSVMQESIRGMSVTVKARKVSGAKIKGQPDA